MKTALVLGAGGFIGSHMATRLKNDGYWVRGVDLKYPEYSENDCHEFVIGDLRDPNIVSLVLFSPTQRTKNDKINSFDIVIQLAADMGGAGFVFSGDNDADIMHNSALINLNVAHYANVFDVKKIFYSSSACIYPQEIQRQTTARALREDDAYPVNPDSEYGYEKIFSERLYDSFRRNYKLNIRVARFHNIFGINGTYQGGREKAPAAMCRKVAEAKDGDEIEVWNDGKQTRSFLYVDECVEGVLRLIESNHYEPINIGSNELVSINDLAQMVIDISGKKLGIKHIPGPQGVRGRNSDNTKINAVLGWTPSQPLIVGLEKTYRWIEKQVNGTSNNS